MTTYRADVRDASGKKAVLVREAESEEALARSLSREGLFTVGIRPELGREHGGFRLTRKNVEQFTASVSMLLDSGLTLRDALSVQAKVFPDGREKRLCERFLKEIVRGVSFARAVEEAGRSFPLVYRGLVRVGEKTGTLESVMKELSAYLVSEREVREKIGNALVYPSIVLSTAVLGVVFLSLFVLPGMAEMFSSLGGTAASEMKGMLSGLRALSIAAAVFVAAAVSAVLFFITMKSRFPARDRSVSRFVLSLPAIGSFLALKEMLSFTFAMETLLQAGVPMEDSLKEAASVLKNTALADEVLSVRDRLLRGKRLSEALSEAKLVPKTVKIWAGIGEETGKAEKVFSELSRYYRRETEAFSARIMVAAEPAVTVVVGIIIITLIVAFVVPLFGMYGAAVG